MRVKQKELRKVVCIPLFSSFPCYFILGMIENVDDNAEVDDEKSTKYQT